MTAACVWNMEYYLQWNIVFICNCVLYIVRFHQLHVACECVKSSTRGQCSLTIEFTSAKKCISTESLPSHYHLPLELFCLVCESFWLLLFFVLESSIYSDEHTDALEALYAPVLCICVWLGEIATVKECASNALVISNVTCINSHILLWFVTVPLFVPWSNHTEISNLLH